jgi:hypothetical protein
MNKPILTLTAAFGLIMSALSAQSADIKITSLPFNIAAPGTYVLTGDLTYTPGASPSAITIFTAHLGGSVIVDLKGFTITGPVSFGYGVYIGENKIATAYPITIRNGTIKNFQYGVWAGGQGDVTINKLIFFLSPSLDTYVTGIAFESVNSSAIHNCTFDVDGPTNGTTYGIEDHTSAGGNSYNNNAFLNVEFPILAEGRDQGTLTLDHCIFAAPTN